MKMKKGNPHPQPNYPNPNSDPFDPLLPSHSSSLVPISSPPPPTAPDPNSDPIDYHDATSPSHLPPPTSPSHVVPVSKSTRRRPAPSPTKPHAPPPLLRRRSHGGGGDRELDRRDPRHAPRAGGGAQAARARQPQLRCPPLLPRDLHQHPHHMVGKAGGSSLSGRRTRTWLVNGTTHLENGMEMLRTKVSKPQRTTGSMPSRRSTLSSATRTRHSCCSSR